MWRYSGAAECIADLEVELDLLDWVLEHGLKHLQGLQKTVFVLTVISPYSPYIVCVMKHLHGELLDCIGFQHLALLVERVDQVKPRL